MTNIRCMQTDFQPEAMGTIVLNNWGTPGCYIETENRRTHLLPYNTTTVNFNYRKIERNQPPLFGDLDKDDPIVNYADLVVTAISFLTKTVGLGRSPCVDELRPEFRA